MKTFHLAVIMLIAGFFLRADHAWGGDWISLGLTASGIEYYNNSDIKKSGKNIFHVRTKIIYNERGKVNRFSLLKKMGKAPGNPYILSYEMKWSELNCNHKKYRISSGGIYDKRGNMIASLPKNDTAWHDMIPRSNEEKLNNIVCDRGNFSKTNPQKARSSIPFGEGQRIQD